MLTLKNWFIIVGAVLCFLGFMCFPIGFGSSPKGGLSLFNKLADLGAFVGIGGYIFCAGLVVIVLTLLISAFVHVIRRAAASRRKMKPRL